MDILANKEITAEILLEENQGPGVTRQIPTRNGNIVIFLYAVRKGGYVPNRKNKRSMGHITHWSHIDLYLKIFRMNKNLIPSLWP
jgi:hypothetical protein